GYTTLYVQPKRQPQIREDDWQVQAASAENRYLHLNIEPDGGLTVTNKATGKTYSGLNHFEDIADAGDAYTFCPLVGDTPISTQGSRAEVRRVWTGANAVCYEIVHRLSIPARLSPDRRSREGEVPLTITSSVTLHRDSPYIQIRTSFVNATHDHKLSVVFPTEYGVPTAHVNESFAVVDRSIDLPFPDGWVEDPTPLMHQRAFTDVSDGQTGLAIFNRGLAAVEVTRTTNGTRIAVPLVRAVGWLSRDDLWVRRIAAGPLVPTPGAQCEGERVAEYAIFPHAAGWETVYPHAYNYVTPVIASRADTHAGIDLHDMNITRDDPARITHIPFPRGGEHPDTQSFLAVEGDGIVLTALRQGTNQLVLRFFNIQRQPTTARLTSAISIAGAHRLNLNEQVQEALALDTAHHLTVPVRAGEIVTIGIVYGA
ncbi:MAG: hypothetical protein IT319_13925, partial [Anaerolineae bacterium]|nr:hypothetical protein [Anaerolineae bacterium]